jgi:hypothetical protein
MAFLAREQSHRPDQTPRAADYSSHADHHEVGLAEALFTSLNAVVFLILMAAVAAAAILYSRGT